MGSVERNLVRAKYSKSAILVGENTAGATGIINKIRINDNIEFYYTGSKNVGLADLQNGIYQSVGLKPDYIVYPTKEGIKENRDEILDNALDVINNIK
jgi:C-terminal processing protease CtpA/Prc